MIKLDHLRAAVGFTFVAIALAFSACSGGKASPAATDSRSVTVVDSTTTTAPPTATPTPDPAVLLRDGGVAMIETAYNRLLDEYIEPQQPDALLNAAWASASTAAGTHGASAVAPSLVGERLADFASFRAAYVALTAGLGDPQDVRFAAIKGMAQSLNDCHTFFLTPVTSDTVTDTRTGRGAVGIGVELAGIPSSVTEVIAGGPAARAGVLLGDRIVMIDGADASALAPASAFDRINGAEGTDVRLQLRRGGSLVDVTIRRERVTPPNVEPRVLAGGIGYIRVRNFVDGGISTDVRAAVAQFEAQGVMKWILDLRDNPGGRLDVAGISLFVKDGVIVRDRGRDGKEEESVAIGSPLVPIRPTVLLADNRTGSVAEVFAAALQQYGVAYVVGAKTNGCVGYTDIEPLGDGSSLAVTTHVNLNPVTDAPLNGIGVIPDESVSRTSTDIVNGVDPQLDAAIAHLGG